MDEIYEPPKSELGPESGKSNFIWLRSLIGLTAPVAALAPLANVANYPGVFLKSVRDSVFVITKVYGWCVEVVRKLFLIIAFALFFLTKGK